jgi:hypothetical protein
LHKSHDPQAAGCPGPSSCVQACGLKEKLVAHDEYPDLSDLQVALAALMIAREDVLGTKPLLGLASTDTALAIGLAAGEIGRAAALLDRDIAKWPPHKTPAPVVLNEHQAAAPQRHHDVDAT